MRRKIISREAARQMREEASRAGKRVVFTNGCFDILHAGHVDYLEAARAEGDLLILGLNSDASVKRIKGEKRPIVEFGDRAAALSGLAAVDAVVEFGEDTPLDLIEYLEPDVLAKGADWAEENIVGAREVKARGGRVARVKLTEGLSTTRIIERIVKTYGK